MEERSKPVNTNDSKLIKLLKNSYNIAPLSLLKEDNTTFLINTESQSLILHKCSHKHGSYLRGLCFQSYLKEKGFPYAFDIVRNTSGGNYVKYEHSFYYMEKKVEGTWISIDLPHDYKKACQVLGAFHSYGAGFMYKDYPLRDDIKRVGYKIQKKRAEASTIKSIIEMKRLFTDFDRSYMSIIEELIKRLELCMQLSFGYENLCQEARQKTYICHNSFINSLLRTESGDFFIKSFTTCSVNIPVYELSELLKSYMSLNVHDCDFNALNELTNAYNQSRPLSSYEYGILLCLLIMPDKLLSIGKKRYIKQKNWSEKKYYQRLDKALCHFHKQQQLIEPFVKAYGISLHSNKL